MFRSLLRPAYFPTSAFPRTVQTALRSAVVRSFATGANAVAKPAAAPAAVLKTSKQALIKQLDSDVSEVQTTPDDTLTDYVRTMKWRVSINKETNRISVTRAVENNIITVEFDAENDPESDMEEFSGEDHEHEHEHEDGEHEHEHEHEQQEDAEDGEDNMEVGWPRHEFTVDIRYTGAEKKAGPNFLRLNCRANRDSMLEISEIDFTESKSEEELKQDALDSFVSGDESASNTLLFEDLSQPSQEAVLNYLEQLGVNDQLAAFVQEQSQLVRTQKYVQQLQQLKAFIAK